MIEILRLAQNDKYVKTPALSCRSRVATRNLKNNRELVMLERSEASIITAKEKRFFRAKPSTTRHITYRNDKTTFCYRRVLQQQVKRSIAVGYAVWVAKSKTSQ